MIDFFYHGEKYFENQNIFVFFEKLFLNRFSMVFLSKFTKEKTIENLLENIFFGKIKNRLIFKILLLHDKKIFSNNFFTIWNLAILSIYHRNTRLMAPKRLLFYFCKFRTNPVVT